MRETILRDDIGYGEVIPLRASGMNYQAVTDFTSSYEPFSHTQFNYTYVLHLFNNRGLVLL